MDKKKQIESTDWLTRDIPKEQLEREKQEAIMSVDLKLCHTEFISGVGEIYTDYDITAQKMFAKGYRKQSEGEWIKHHVSYECTACKDFFFVDGYAEDYDPITDFDLHFCPNCGAKMRKEDVGK